MRPELRFLSVELINRVLDEAFQLLRDHGVKVQNTEARDLLDAAGARVDHLQEIVYIPEQVARDALASVPREFYLHNRSGEPTVRYGGDSVHFDPGSAGVTVLDPDTLQHRPSETHDLLRVIQVTEQLSQYDAQSTALLCHDVPSEIGDLYRLYLVLLHSAKPIVTGGFTAPTTRSMIEMLAIAAGGADVLARKPLSVFDVCPSPPLIWSDLGAQNLIDLARAFVPAEIVSMPLAGAAAPVTLLGSVVQHAAECISGMTIHQLAQPGAPIVWGGAPAIMDMRHGTTPMGAIETAMIDASYAQVGKSFGFPTHTYLCASDAKIVDVQAGLESGMTALIGALAGINMISGAGMLDFLLCVSPEKLVIDAEIIGMVKRLLEGTRVHGNSLALEMFSTIQFEGEFLKQRVTRELFRQEQYLPSEVIDRGSTRAWAQADGTDAFARAKSRADSIVAEYQRPEFPLEQIAELTGLVQHLAGEAGMERLPVASGY